MLVDGQFAQEPTETEYPDIPIIEGKGNDTPLANRGSGAVVLQAEDGVWQYKCSPCQPDGDGSPLGTFGPPCTITNEDGFGSADLDIARHHHPPAPWHQGRCDSDHPNMPLAQAMISQMEASSSLKAPSRCDVWRESRQPASGLRINLLADAAKGRINALRESMEWAMATVDEIALGLVEAYAGAKGVAVWGWNEGAEDVNVKLTPSDINGYYENYVRITPSLPDDLQKQGIGLQQSAPGC